MEARASAAFVGRVRELDELGRALQAAQAGDGATVLVAGEAGIGKSRLAAEVAHRARAAGFEVLLGRSLDLVGTELPYQPFADALPSFAEVRGGGLAAARVRGGARAARRPRRGRAGPARARGPALGRRVDARSRRLPRAQPRRPAGAAARDLPAGRAGIGRARTPARRRGAAVGLGGSARARAARPRRARRPARGAGRGAARGGAGRDPRPLRGQPVLRRGAARRFRRGGRGAPARACATC